MTPQPEFPFTVVCISNRPYLASSAVGDPGAPGPEGLLEVWVTVGKSYEVSNEYMGMYAIIDDTDESCWFPKSRFRLISRLPEKSK